MKNNNWKNIRYDHIIVILIFIIVTSCGGKSGPIYHELVHPSWQDNYYKYRNLNNPQTDPLTFYRYPITDTDTVLTDILQFPDTKILNVNSSHISELPQDLKKLKHLFALDATYTDMKEFPRIIFELSSLIRFDIAFRDSSIRVDTICYNFKRLPKLEMLSLIACGLEDIPSTITDMKRLKYLNLSSNKIQNINTPLENLDSLIELDISGNYLTQIPRQISSLTNLEILNLSENDIHSLDLQIEKLLDIRELNLISNPNFKLTVKMAKEIKEKWKFLEEIKLNGTNHTEQEQKELLTILPGQLTFNVVCGTP